MTINNSNQDNRRVIQKRENSSRAVLDSEGKTPENKSQATYKEKMKNEVKTLERKNQKKSPASATPTQNVLNLKPERDFRRFKVRYNTGIGNIMRNWMSLMYSILILRMNLINFIFAQFPHMQDKNKQLSQQILLESKVIYHMIRKAQYLSQEKTWCLWTHLEKLINNRLLLKNYLETARKKNFSFKDWKGMASKLELMQTEFNKVRNLFDSVKAERNQKEKALTTKVKSLENLARSKDEVIEQLIEQITQLKKKELEMRCRIMNHLKAFRDLNSRKRQLHSMEKELRQLKNGRDQIAREFSSKMKALKLGIQEKDKEIKIEKEERKKLRKALKEFRNFQPRPSGLQETVVEN